MKGVWQQQHWPAAHRYPPSSVSDPDLFPSLAAVRRAHCPVPAVLASLGQRACVAAPSETIGWDDLDAIRSVVEAQLCTNTVGWSPPPASP